MGEEVGGVPEAAPVDPERSAESSAGASSQGSPHPGDAAGASIGRYLARQRRLREISLDELVQLTKIPRRSLERLEAGAFDHAPDGFVRGFVRTVAEALGLDPAEAVMRLMNEPEEDESGFSGARLGRPPQLAVLGLAALGVLMLFLLWTLLAGWLAATPPVPTPEVVVREDPVRALAIEEAEREDQPAAREDQPAAREDQPAAREDQPAAREAAPEQRVPPPRQAGRGDRELAR